MAWPAVKENFTQEGFRRYVSGLAWTAWRPSMVVWHNTAAPSLKQWMDYAAKDAAAGRVPGITRIQNLEKYFRTDNHWSGCPHLFIANDFIWVMNPLTAPGVHSPSWNSTSIGIEMVGDFAREDDDTGPGLAVKQNTIYATAVLCETLGIDPATRIRLHKEDPRTTHDCPGENIAKDKSAMIRAVQELMAGGEHRPEATAKVIAAGFAEAPQANRLGTVTTDGLNFRAGPSALAATTGSLPRGTRLTILDEASNATTKWLKVRTPAGYVGWVAGRYVNEGETA